MAPTAARPNPRDVIVRSIERLKMLKCDFADLLGVSPRTVSRWWRGGLRPSPARLERMLAKLGAVDPSGASELAASFGREFHVKVEPRPFDGAVSSVAGQAYLAAEALEIAPAKLRAALVRVCESAIAHGWSVAHVRDQLLALDEAAKAG